MQPESIVTSEPSPIDTYSTAKGYLQAAKMVWLSPHRTGPNVYAVFLPMHLLLGFAAELYLKSWLLETGKTDRELRANGVRHSLKQLLTDAYAAGLPVDSRLDSLIDKLHKPHEKFEYRYMRSDMKFDGDILPEGFDIFDRLDNVVDTKVGASASHGLVPGR